MIGLQRLFLWALVCHVSTQNDVSTPEHELLKRDLGLDVANERNSRSAIDSKTIPYNNAFASNLFVPQITEQCLRTGICEYVPNYPEEHIRAIVQAARLDPSQFDNDFHKLKAGNSLRVGDDFLDLCQTEERIITPQAAKNMRNEWNFIVNTKGRLSQSFRVEVCKYGQGPCSNIVTFPMGYRGWCQQKYILRDMLAVNKHGQLVKEAHELPSCCSCVYGRN